MRQETLTIGELAARSGVATSALRYYERLGLIRAGRTGGNQRRFDRAELRRVAFIRISQQLGVSLEEIRGALAELPDGRTPTKADWARLSARWRRRLDEKIDLMTRLRDDLTNCIGCGCLSLRGCNLYNPDDELAAQGPGPRRMLPAPPAGSERPADPVKSRADPVDQSR
ncbi:redox-sensitive transcriptional activator SoxR [Plantactinospora sp. ZYX-F-223]|uniref:redox-sensitive transcriptional activator SoxR n=1 Tax=Plantactinospora sp. ZYX-F-223 TaxID=3144103 RepID=UPI0031FE3BF0